MIQALDSAYPPSDAQIAAARAAGRKAWAGYFAGPNILNGWSQADFDRVRAGGMGTWAYVSGWSNPATLRAQSDSWGIPICLDVEGGIRGFGSWVAPWLGIAAPCGLYGNPPVHAGIPAAFHICAAYPGYEPATTWPAYLGRPTAPCAWQWQGSHNEFGITVDSIWADDTFLSFFGSQIGNLAGVQAMKVIGAMDGGSERWITDGITKRGIHDVGEQGDLLALTGQSDALLIHRSTIDYIPDYMAPGAVASGPTELAKPKIVSGTFTGELS